MKLRHFLGLGAALALVLVGTSAVAGPGPTTCAGGTIAAGKYKDVTVTGICTFAGDKVDIDGDLVVAAGASLNDHAASTTEVRVKGDVLVGDGGVVGLGTYNPNGNHKSEVNGSVIATNPTSLYLSFIKIHGDLISSGGSGPGRNLPLKDITVDGDLVVVGWTGFWSGLIRDKVHGNVVYSNNSGDNPDSSEIMTNDIHGNLVCTGNTPVAAVNPDDGGEPNKVHGVAAGECEGLTG